jgi:hypothetical protein
MPQATLFWVGEKPFGLFRNVRRMAIKETA